jgi:hypothetical protein
VPGWQPACNVKAPITCPLAHTSDCSGRCKICQVPAILFYSRFIPNFEVRISPLRKIMKDNYTLTIGSAWTPAANAAFKEMRQEILSDPCLRQYDHHKLLARCTDFSKDGFRSVACQPANNKVSLAMMNCCMRSMGFDFMTKTSLAVLHPVAFGCCRTRGNKKSCTLISGKDLLAIGPLPKTAICALVNDSLGSQIAMQSNHPVV